MKQKKIEIGDQIVRSITKKIQKRFTERIVCFLYYGSKAFSSNLSEISDYDFYLLLDSPQPNDTNFVRSIISEYPILDFSIQYESLLHRKGYARFQHGNHGAFFAQYLSHAKCLLGTNIFREIANMVSNAEIRRSLIFQIEEYFWRLNRWYLYEEHTECIAARMKKYLIRIVIDILLFHETILYDEINTSHEELYAKYVSHTLHLGSEVKKEMKSLMKNSFCDSCEHLLKIRDLLYLDYLDIVEKYDHGNAALK